MKGVARSRLCYIVFRLRLWRSGIFSSMTRLRMPSRPSQRAHVAYGAIVQGRLFGCWMSGGICPEVEGWLS